MKIGTTPRHTFTLPFSTDGIEEIEIMYSQNGKNKLRKTKDDCALGGNEIVCQLTQEDTFQFCGNAIVSIQLRVRTNTGEVLASDIISRPCMSCLSKEVL